MEFFLVCFNLLFPGSAAVAQVPVKHLVVGSNPTRGALRQAQCKLLFIQMNRKMNWYTYISHATIIKIESGGIQSPTIDTVQKITKALGVSLDDLMK